MVETRKRKSPSSSSCVTKSLTLWDLQIHTTIEDVLKPLKRFGNPTFVSFINVDNRMTKYTWCSHVDMESVDQANEVLRRKFVLINGVKVKVTEQTRTEVFEGTHKLVIKNMDWFATKAFKTLRIAFEDWSCSDIEVLKKLGSDKEDVNYPGCTVRLMFRTEEGRTEAIKILNMMKKRMVKEWIVEEVE